MKKILITGAGSYIGTAFASYMEQWQTEYAVETVDMIDPAWRDKDFSGYDAIFHVAGIAHRKETAENAELYYRVNRDLAIEVAKKAKDQGVGQMIFLSSMSVYGKDTGVITKETEPAPQSHYGRSKLEAEQGIAAVVDDTFRVAVLRPPMVYGSGCPGNFGTVIKLVRKLPVFPRLHNERSMIYIEHLCAFVKKCVDEQLSGLYFPQNKEYLRTVDMARVIARSLGKKRYFSCLLGLGVVMLRPFVGIARKGFGTLIYRDTEEFMFDYCTVDNETSVRDSVPENRL